MIFFFIDLHSKVPTKLETGSITIKYILTRCRVNYLYTMLSRDEEEPTRHVYCKQKK